MTHPPASSVRQPTFSEVWDSIVDCAAELTLTSGGQLPCVRDLAERVRVKPSVVRDALLQAQAKGAVRIVPRVGAFLAADPDEARQRVRGTEAHGSAWSVLLGREMHNILHVLDARRLVEVELIGRSAARRRLEDLLPARAVLESMLNLSTDATRLQYVELDFRFHAALTQPAGNDVLQTLQRTFNDLLWKRLADLPADLEQRMISDRFHASIYAAVAEGDADRARREMHEHLSLAYDYLLSTLQHPPTTLATTKPEAS